MAWHVRTRGDVLVELLVDGRIVVHGRDKLDDAGRRWVAEVAEPELRAALGQREQRRKQWERAVVEHEVERRAREAGRGGWDS